jgi:hypothetical protein
MSFASYLPLAMTLEAIHAQNGGLTWNLKRGNVYDLAELKCRPFVGIVSVHPKLSRLRQSAPTARDFEQFILENEARLTASETWLCVGSWYDAEHRSHCLDLSQVCFNHRKAHYLGFKHRQDSIYLLNEKTSEIVIGPSTYSRAAKRTVVICGRRLSISLMP